jgi:hypothetical protein
MKFSSQNICPFCHKEVLVTATWCGNCGRDLPTNDLEILPKNDFYEIVPDGEMFGIAPRGKIRMDGLELEDAQSILTALNRSRGFDKLDK